MFNLQENSYFNRQEVIKLTGVSGGQLSYLDRIKSIVPMKQGNPKRPEVFYTIEQLVKIKITQKLKLRLSPHGIFKVLEVLSKQNYRQVLFSCDLVLINQEVYFIEDMAEFGKAIFATSSENNGEISINEIGAIGDIFAELKESGKNIVNFEKKTEKTIIQQPV